MSNGIFPNKNSPASFSDSNLLDLFSITALGLCVYAYLSFFILGTSHFEEVGWFVLVYILLFYFLGIFTDAIFNLINKLFLEKLLDYIAFSKPLKWMSKKILSDNFKENDKIQIALVKEKLLKKYPDKFRSHDNESDIVRNNTILLKDSDLMVWARTFLELNNISHRYISFFTKHRVYTNLAVLCIINCLIAILFFFYASFSFWLILSISLLFFLFASVILHLYAKKFWLYASGEIYKKFLLFD